MRCAAIRNNPGHAAHGGQCRQSAAKDSLYCGNHMPAEERPKYHLVGRTLRRKRVKTIFNICAPHAPTGDKTQ